MPSTTPNKEIVRRICHLHGATECHLLVDTGDLLVDVLTNITTDKISNCVIELEQWSGLKFRVYNFDKKNKLDNDKVSNILSRGEVILPIKP